MRPLPAVFYLAVYMCPLSFPLVASLQRRQLWCATMFAVSVFIAVMATSPDILQWGPIKSGIEAIGARSGYQRVLLAALTAVVAFNAWGVTDASIIEWKRLGPLCSFSIFFLLFFVIEQVGVGGNIQFYERYTLQAAPFLGLIGLRLVPRLDCMRLGSVCTMFAFSHWMLWRYWHA